jgi:hypothetical protein
VVTDAEIRIDNDVILDGEGNLTVDGNDDHRVFSVTQGATAELRGFTVTRGRSVLGGGISIGWGRLWLTNSTVSGNNGFGLSSSWGAPATLTNTTISGNSEGSLEVVCTKHVFNDCGWFGLTNSTVSGDTACLSSNGFECGEPDVLSFSTLTNTVIDGVCGETWRAASNGYNIESPGDTCGFDQEGDQANVSEGQLNLGPLQDNGGGTQTHALLPGSVAIDVIPADMCEVDEDQRGVTRPQGDACDVGAFEVEVTP